MNDILKEHSTFFGNSPGVKQLSITVFESIQLISLGLAGALLA